MTWFDEHDLSRGMEPVPITVDVPVEGTCPMELFVYVKDTILSTESVVDNERESSCRCYGQDCSLNPGQCECIMKNGGECVYNDQGLLQDHDKSGEPKVRTKYSSYCFCNMCSKFA